MAITVPLGEAAAGTGTENTNLHGWGYSDVKLGADTKTGLDISVEPRLNHNQN
jgi:hypothetical protein